MYLATSAVVLKLRLGACRSARQRRKAVAAMMEKLRRHFNVAAADLAEEAPPDRAVLAFVAAGRHRREAREVLERLVEAVSAHPYALLDSPPEVVDY